MQNANYKNKPRLINLQGSIEMHNIIIANSIVNIMNIRKNIQGISVFEFRSSAANFLNYRHSFQIAIWFLIIIILKYDVLLEPPVWDSAMGVFPAAIFLHDSGFDYQALLQQSGWWQGGPNVHSLSLLPLLIAIVFLITDSNWIAFFVIHCLIILSVSWSLVVFSRTLKSYCNDCLLILVTTCGLLAMPLVLVQVGYMYQEILVLVFSVAAWSSWKDGRCKTTLFYCTIAIAFKLTGIAIIICVVISVLIDRRLWNAMNTIVVVSLGIVSICFLLLPQYFNHSPDVVPGWQHKSLFLTALLRLLVVPDLMIVVYIGIRSGIIYLSSIIKSLKDQSTFAFTKSTYKETNVYTSAGLSVCFLMPIVFALGVIYQISNDMLFLSRYLTPIIPFALASYIIQGHIEGKSRNRLYFILIFTVISIINYNGILYTKETRRFSVVERSHAYKGFFQLQTDMVGHITRSYQDIPVYVSRELWYLTSDPKMGHVDQTMNNIKPIFRDDFNSISLESYPDQFVLVLSNLSHGGILINSIAREAIDEKYYEVDIDKFRVGEFKGNIFKIMRVSD